MKFIIRNSQPHPSQTFTELVRSRIEKLRRILRIDEARVFIDRRPEASPPFRLTAHLVTPGPDVQAEAVDHTPQAALQKLIAHLEAGIVRRRHKQKMRRKSRGPTLRLAAQH